MRITVYPPPLIKPQRIPPDNILELPPGATLVNVYRCLGIPLLLSPLLFCLVNHEKAGLRTKLQEGDVVSFFTLAAGG